MLPLAVTRIYIDGQQERGWHNGTHSALRHPFPARSQAYRTRLVSGGAYG